LNAQPLFNIDVCAPLIGATGQFSRLASEKHGIIFVPQIDFLPAEGKSLGRTCTTNQGGVAIAHQLAKSKYPKSNFCLFTLSLKNLEPKSLTHQLYKKFQKIFKFYNLQITSAELKQAITNAIEQNTILRNNLADKVSDIIEESIKNKKDITVVCGREYILNPGIFDSHVGKLLRDKAVTAIPSYALDCYLDPNFSYIYWKNPHDIVTKINAIVQKKLHTILKNQRLKSLIKKIEDGKTDSSISPLQVSTFRCGPDTVIAPLLAEITKRTPSLLIQSDAMIKELAHLENRINTYINQLKKKLHQAFVNEYFEIKIVEEFDAQAINKETDVIYFPTLHDNRILTSIFRSAGFTAIDNYQDKSYDLEQKVRLGRKYAGDSVCAPLAGVFADMVLAVDDFIKRKKANDKLIINKKRILIFDNKGTGPCRQGQYFEMHKILLNRLFGFNSCQKNISKPIDYYVRLLVGHEHNNYNVGLEEWALIQSFQGLILHGTLHSVLLRFGANCKDYYQYQKFYADYLKLKKDIYWILENKIRPNDKLLKKISKISKLSSSLGIMSKYFAYGLYNNNGLRTALKKFSNKWLKIQSSINKHKLRIHIEGEAYMRAAQVEDIFNSLVDTIGFNSFTLNYSPLWCYVELLLEFGILNLEEEISLETKTTEIRNKKKRIRDLQLTIKILRNVLARPLYKASKVEMPEPMKKILEYSSLILPTLKPQGELPPYLGEAILKVNDGIDLFLNVAPEGCMVSSMGQLFTDSVLEVTGKKTMIKDLFTLNGEVNHEQLQMALLKTLGPQRYYKQ
jgi:predicted nucleotide-binding protein (sugar kinase/HSP70/actin superfamily)